MPTNDAARWSDLLAQVPPLDIAALVFFLAVWMGYVWFADGMHGRKRNLVDVMNRYRTAWMRQMLKRDNRMVDASMMGNLMRSISFFANTSILILFGIVTMFGYRDKAEALLHAVPYASDSSPLLWEVKILLLMLIFVYSFFKYSWSLRQYNYASTYVGAAPLPFEAQHLHNEIAKRGARLITNAAKHFNNGLRAYYFGLGALAWFVHPVALMITTAWVVLILYRREFKSHTLLYLSQNQFIDATLRGREVPTPVAPDQAS